MSEIAEVSAPEETRTSIGERWVTFANDLTRAAHKLTLGEKRLVAACIAQVKSDSPVPTASERDRKMFTVTADQYCELYAVERETAYGQMKTNATTLFGKEIHTVRPDGRAGRRVRWVQEIQYNEGEASVTLMWSDALCLALFNLKDQFTTYKLRYAANLTSKYAWTLFELLAMWRRRGNFSIDVDQFRDKLDVKPSQRANYKELRTRVIEPAAKEIHEKCGIVVTVVEKKRGKRVTDLAFSWEPDPQGTLNF
jgi:plasmid replication initiation protein